MGCPQTREEMIARGMVGLKPKGDEYSDEVREKTKGSSSDRRKFAQKLSGLKNCNPENFEKYALEIINSPQTSALEIIRLYKEILNDELSPMLKIQLMGRLIQSHTAIHGNKVELSGKLLFENQMQDLRNEQIAKRVVQRAYLENLKEEWKIKFGEIQSNEMVLKFEMFMDMEPKAIAETAHTVSEIFNHGGYKSPIYYEEEKEEILEVVEDG